MRMRFGVCVLLVSCAANLAACKKNQDNALLNEACKTAAKARDFERSELRKLRSYKWLNIPNKSDASAEQFKSELKQVIQGAVLVNDLFHAYVEYEPFRAVPQACEQECKKHWGESWRLDKQVTVDIKSFKSTGAFALFLQYARPVVDMCCTAQMERALELAAKSKDKEVSHLATGLLLIKRYTVAAEAGEDQYKRFEQYREQCIRWFETWVPKIMTVKGLDTLFGTSWVRLLLDIEKRGMPSQTTKRIAEYYVASSQTLIELQKELANVDVILKKRAEILRIPFVTQDTTPSSKKKQVRVDEKCDRSRQEKSIQNEAQIEQSDKLKTEEKCAGHTLPIERVEIKKTVKKTLPFTRCTKLVSDWKFNPTQAYKTWCNKEKNYAYKEQLSFAEVCKKHAFTRAIEYVLTEEKCPQIVHEICANKLIKNAKTLVVPAVVIDHQTGTETIGSIEFGYFEDSGTCYHRFWCEKKAEEVSKLLMKRVHVPTNEGFKAELFGSAVNEIDDKEWTFIKTSQYEDGVEIDWMSDSQFVIIKDSRDGFKCTYKLIKKAE